MKRTKKLLAMVLALMMALSCMAMPAMAHGDGDEGIMPLKPAYQCRVCYGAATYNGIEHSVRASDSYRVGPGKCPQISVEHTHRPYDIMEVYRCGNCGWKYLSKIGESYECIMDSVGR